MRPDNTGPHLTGDLRARPPRQAPGRLALIAVVLIAANLRAGISSFGPVLDDVRHATGLSAGAAGLVTSMPLLCFAAFGSLAPWLARRLGIDRAIGGSIALLAASLLARVAGGTGLLMAGTLAACAGIAVANVLLPVVVKLRFPDRVGPVTGAYTAALAGGSALAAAISAPLAEVGDWRIALGSWSVAAMVAGVVWLAFVRSDRRTRQRDLPRTAAARPAVAKGVVSKLVRQPVTWALAIFFGTQAVLAYVQMGWLPSIYTDAGFDAGTAGALLSVAIVVGVPVSFVVPTLASRSNGQRTWAVGLTLVAAAALVGLLLAPGEGAWAWAVLLGIGSGTFPLVLTMFSLRTGTPDHTAAMSAFAQGVGYLLAALGPVTLGAVHEATGEWHLPILVILGVMALQAAAGLVAGRNVVIGPTRPGAPGRLGHVHPDKRGNLRFTDS